MQDRAPLEARARSRAVEDAFDKARDYAYDAQIELGDVMVLTEEISGDAGYRAPVAEMAMARSGGVPIAQGEITARAQIKIIFAAKSGN